MFTLQLWFWAALTSAAGIVFLTAAIHGPRRRHSTFSLRLTQRESAIDSHKRAFRMGAMAANVARAAKMHWLDYSSGAA